MDRDAPLVVRLPRQPGRKENRFAHLLAGAPEIEDSEATPVEPARLKVAAEDDRVNRLEAEVAGLRNEIEDLRQQLREFKAQFD